MKMDSFLETMEDDMGRPTILIYDETHPRLAEKRRKAWKRFLKKVLAIPQTEKKAATEILRKWRKKQRKLLHQKDIEDPHPFEHKYIFYCLEVNGRVDM